MITGERVSAPEGGFNPTFQRHVAAYRLSAPRLGEGRVLDLGCGVGHSFAELGPRKTVGVDVDPAALAGQERETVVADMRRLPFADASFASVISVHSIEHVPDPERALREVVRILSPGGRAVFVTPNRLTFGPPEEIIDPYHYVEYAAAELEALCSAVFAHVEVLGLFGSARYQRLVDAERRELDRLLRLDPLRLRRLVPRRARQRLYDRRLAASRAVPAPGAVDIAPEDFRLAPGPLDAALDLVAVCAVS
ncbi:MAG TPA: class I SAM-dependent methyltransferase [Solirubrobacteraceae bacterium]|nr:class I SAM-dependent methyltransferase [Solirubrobacteraceae bacterium]